jgi:hypothetical protein
MLCHAVSSSNFAIDLNQVLDQGRVIPTTVCALIMAYRRPKLEQVGAMCSSTADSHGVCTCMSHPPGVIHICYMSMLSLTAGRIGAKIGAGLHRRHPLRNAHDQPRIRRISPNRDLLPVAPKQERRYRM